MQLSDGTKVCIYIDYEEKEVEGMTHQAIVRFLAKEWSLKSTEIEEIIKENQLNIDSNLTKRHIEIIKLVQEGLTNQEIASILLISPNTVRDHLKEIMRRLNTNSRTGVINICLRIGII